MRFDFFCVFRSKVATHESLYIVSILLFGVALVLPSLLPFHSKPVPRIFIDGLAVLFFFLAASVHPPKFSGAFVCDKTVVFSLILLLVSLVLRFDSGFGSSVYVFYVIFFGVAYFFGAAGSGGFGWVVAAFLVLSGLLQAVIVLCQSFGFDANGWFLPMASGRAVGNVGNPNVLADGLLFGLAALAHPSMKRFGRWFFWGAAALLGVAVSATGSRFVWLSLASFVVVAVFASRRHDGRSFFRVFSIVAVVVACQLALTSLHLSGGWQGSTVFARERPQEAANGKLYMADISYEAIKQKPLLGYGVGSFWTVSADALQDRPAQDFPMLIENAHNFFLQLAVEFGLLVVLPISLCVLLWWWRRLSTLRDGDVWALCCVGSVSVHSLIEYPLWFATVLLPVALCMGVLDGRKSDSLVLGRVQSQVFRVVCVVGFFVCVVTALDWLHVSLAYKQVRASGELTARVMSLSAKDELSRVSKFSLLAPEAHALAIESSSLYSDEAFSNEALVLCESGWKKYPTWFQLKACAEQFARSGRESDLREVANVLCKGFKYQDEFLRNWVRDFDLSASTGLRLGGHACF